MQQPHPHRRLAASFIAAALGLLAACSPAPQSPPATELSTSAADAHAAHAKASRANNGELTPDQLKAIADVRKATTQFHDTAAARAAGYTKQYPVGCATSAEGAQGFHYLNEALVDDKVELLRPELVMYEPGPNGQRNLVGVDYIVPLSASAQRPTLLGIPFDSLGAPLNVWALHIWAWRPNPSGMFSLWNPNVSCAYENATPRQR